DGYAVTATDGARNRDAGHAGAGECGDAADNGRRLRPNEEYAGHVRRTDRDRQRRRIEDQSGLGRCEGEGARGYAREREVAGAIGSRDYRGTVARDAHAG